MTDADRLREAGLRVTSARLAILEVVRAGSHPGTDEIARAAGPAPCLEPAASAGFAIDRAEVTFWGLCPDCQTTSKPNEKECAHDR